MKKTFLVGAITLVFLGCNSGTSSGGDNLKTDVAGIPDAVIGSWEVESMSVGPYEMTPERPNPNDPFRKRNFSDWMQLNIDENNFSLITTDFITQSEAIRPYRIEGQKIVTIDQQNFDMSDFIVHGYSADILLLSFVSQEGASDAKWKFRRISPEQLATKTAQELTFLSAISTVVETPNQKTLSIQLPEIPYAKLKEDGDYNIVTCYLSTDKNLNFSYYVMTKTGSTYGSDSSKDSVRYEFTDLPLDLSGPQKNVTSKLGGANVTASFQGQVVQESFIGCDQSVERTGAKLQIRSICKGRDNKTVTLDGTCLLKHSVW